jgi:outer membrane biosynthesis protein TonB
LTKVNKKVQGLVDSLSSELLSMKDQCDQDSKRRELEHKKQVEELNDKLKELIQQQENCGVEMASLMEENAELKNKNQEEQKAIEDLQVKLSKFRAGVRGSQAAEREREKEKESERERAREKMEQKGNEKKGEKEKEKAKGKEKEKQQVKEKEKEKEKEKRKVVARSTPSKPKEKRHEHTERFPDDKSALQDKGMSSEDTNSKVWPSFSLSSFSVLTQPNAEKIQK